MDPDQAAPLIDPVQNAPLMDPGQTAPIGTIRPESIMFASMKKLVWTINMNISSNYNNQTTFLGQKNINRTRVNKNRTYFVVLMLYIPVNNFSVIKGCFRVFLG